MAKSRDLPPNPLDELRRNLETLKLFAMLEALDPALEQAQTLQQGYATFFGGLVQAQVIAVTESAAERRRKAANFPNIKTFDTFDFAFQPGLNVQLVKDLMSLSFVRQARPVLILGKPGTGKSHMSLAYGHLATLAGHSVRFYACKTLLAELYASLADSTTDRLVAKLARLDLLILDDLRHVPPRLEYASLLADVIEARHEKKATILSSNLSVDEWGKALGNPVLTTSLADRLMERAHVVNIRRGKSYRVYGPDAPPEQDRPRGLGDDPEDV